MATKLSDVLEQESSGIMFPFRTNVKPVKTEQQVYTPTDGIMNVTGTQYEGPSATITYGSEEQGFPRQLKEIEKGLLPRFDQSQFPDVGKGKVETTTTPTTQPVEPDKPIMDPCPPGFKLIDGVCQPIQQQPQQDRGGRDRPTFTGPKISASGVIEGYTSVLGRDRPTAGRYDAISKEYGKAVADKVFEVNQTYRNRGAQLKAITNAEKNRILNVYGEERLNKDYVEGNDGVFYRVVATSPTISELVTDAAIATGKIVDDAVTKGAGFIGAAKALADELGEYLEGESKKSDTSDTTVTKDGPDGPPNTQTDANTQTEKTPTLTTEDFGGIDNISDTVENFKTLQTNVNNLIVTGKTLQDRLNAVINASKTANRADIAKYNRAENNLRREIAKNKRDKNIAIQKSKEKEKQMQEELSNSKESTMTVKGSNFTVHTNDKGKIIGYSKPGSNIVNMAGMPPVGPGQQIKSSGGGNKNKTIGGNQTTKKSVSERLSSAKKKAGGLFGGGR